MDPNRRRALGCRRKRQRVHFVISMVQAHNDTLGAFMRAIMPSRRNSSTYDVSMLGKPRAYCQQQITSFPARLHGDVGYPIQQQHTR